MNDFSVFADMIRYPTDDELSDVSKRAMDSLVDMVLSSEGTQGTMVGRNDDEEIVWSLTATFIDEMETLVFTEVSDDGQVVVGYVTMPGLGATMIAEERRRQINDEGWTPEHDDQHQGWELIEAASCYLDAAIQADSSRDLAATRAEAGRPATPLSETWPWDESWWKPSDDPVRNLVKAGALIAAEIDRLQRVAEEES